MAAPTNCGVATPASITVVINKKHCFSPLDWAPGDLASVGGYPLRAEAAGQMIAMMIPKTVCGRVMTQCVMMLVLLLMMIVKGKYRSGSIGRRQFGV